MAIQQRRDRVEKKMREQQERANAGEKIRVRTINGMIRNAYNNRYWMRYKGRLTDLEWQGKDRILIRWNENAWYNKYFCYIAVQVILWM